MIFISNYVIYNRFNRRPTIAVSCRSVMVPEYAKVIGEDGLATIVKTGEFNLVDYIQASREGTEVYSILERYQNGDVNAINKVQGFYADITNMPGSLMDAFAKMQKANNMFDQLPLEIRKEFNFSKELFAKESSSDKVKDVFKSYISSKISSTLSEESKASASEEFKVKEVEK